MCYGNLDPKYAMRDIEARAKHLSAAQGAMKPATSLPQAVLLAKGATRRFLQVLVAAAAFAVTGCVDTSAPPEIPRNTPLSAELRTDVLDSAIANEIAKRCRGSLMLNRAAVQQVKDRAQVEAKRRGLSRATEAEVAVVMGGERAIQDRLLGYVQSRKILINQPSTWCAAGKRELAEKTGISRYLL